MFKASTKSAALIAALGVLFWLPPGDADACSYAPAAWNVGHRGDTITTAPDEPLVVLVEGWNSPSEELPPLTEDAFTASLTTPDGDVPVSVGIEPGLTDFNGRVVVTPDEPLSPDVEYTLTVAATNPDWPSEITVPVVLVDSLAEPTPTLSLSDATELQREDTETCCQADSAEDSSCYMDDCGDWAHGEECRICWSSTYRYPIALSLGWELPDDVALGRYTHRLVRVDEDGNALEVVTEVVHGGQGGIQWPQDSAGPFCARVEVEDVISGTTSSSDVLCVDAGEVTRLERTSPETTQFEDRCKAGTVDETAPDDQDGSPADSGKADPGCCSTVHAREPVAAVWLVLLALLWCARRRA